MPDDVLRKPGALTAVRVRHDQTTPRARRENSAHGAVPGAAHPIVELHHERPDGNGYPHGLSGDDIPLAARIVHVADAYDAMTNARAYRPGRPRHEALSELWQCAGTEFHAEVVSALASALPVVTTVVSKEPVSEACVA